jgi:hypothetical protein
MGVTRVKAMKSPLLWVGLWVKPCLTLVLYGAPRLAVLRHPHPHAGMHTMPQELAPHRAVGILALHIRATLFTQRHGDLIILLPWMASEDQTVILRNP